MICQNTSVLTINLKVIPTSELNRLRREKEMISKSLFRFTSPLEHRSSLPTRIRKKLKKERENAEKKEVASPKTEEKKVKLKK